MSGIKRAALLVHSLDPADQAWMLARLPAAGRPEVEAALGELQSLGIPPDPSLAGALPLAPTREQVAQDSAASKALRRADAASVLQALRGQAPQAVAALLSLQAWPWRQAVREHWAGALSAHPGVSWGPAHAVPPALRASLVQAVAARLAPSEDVAARPAARPRGWLARWLPRRTPRGGAPR
ncbi:MAG: hypothetical protein EPO12_05445 [Aquabacterium sp.]|jgi:hypothetical protein|nr:MAG: hypothetical protein EPO12_05445 [Aquabacterium sp.]